MSDGIIQLSREDLDKIVEAAAERGAKKALADVGLHDDGAGNDVRDLRNLLDTWRGVSKNIRHTSVNTLTKLIIFGLLAFAGVKSGLINLGK